MSRWVDPLTDVHGRSARADRGAGFRSVPSVFFAANGLSLPIKKSANFPNSKGSMIRRATHFENSTRISALKTEKRHLLYVGTVCAQAALIISHIAGLPEISAPCSSRGRQGLAVIAVAA